MGLSGREREVLRLVVADLKESEIAHRLSISTHTVHTYLDRMYRKLSVTSRLQLVLRMFATLREMSRMRPPD